MNEKELRDILEKFFNHTLGVSYKNPMMVYDTNSLLSVVGKTVGVPATQLKQLKLIIEKAQKTGRINDKLVKGLYKSIVETGGDLQLSALILDKSKPVAERISKILELVYAPSYKGLHRNMVTNGPATNYDLNQTLQDIDITGRTRRMPDGPTGFVPAYTNVLAAIAAIQKGFIAAVPYRKVTNNIGKKVIINESQSDLFLKSAEAAADFYGIKKINPSGDIYKFDMTPDKYNDITRILHVVLADAELIKKYAWQDLLDPEVLAKLNNELQDEINKKKAEVKNKPVLDAKGQGMINSLKEWKATQPDSWFGNNPTIINSCQMGVEEAALERHNKSGLNTGGTAPAGFIANPVSNPKIFPQKGKEYNLQPLYNITDETDGIKPSKVDDGIDSAKVYEYIMANASNDFKNHINKLAAMGFDDVALKLAESFIYAKPRFKEEGFDRGWSVKKGKQAEFSLAKQINVDAADLNVIIINSKNPDEVSLKTAMYSLYGEYKLPANLLGFYAGNRDYVIKSYTPASLDWQDIADELRKKSTLKRPDTYWEAAAKAKIKEIARTISDKDLFVNTYTLQGQDAKKNTYVIDLQNFRHNTFAGAMEEFVEELIGKGMVIQNVNGQLTVVNKDTNASQLFPVDTSYKIHVTGDTSIIGGYYKDLTDRIVQALVSPEAYYEQIAKPQIMNENMKGGQVQADYTKSPVALNDYNVVNNEDMTKVMTQEGQGGNMVPDYNNPNVVSQVDLIRDGKQKGFLIREADLLKKLNVPTVKEAIKILETNPQLRLTNFDQGKETKVNIVNWEKLEGYKFGKTERMKDGNFKLTEPNKTFIDKYLEILGNPTATFKKSKKLNPETSTWETGDEKVYLSDGQIEYIINQSRERSDKYKNKIDPKPFWLLEVGEVVSPAAKKAEAINEALRAIESSQLQDAKFWSWGQDPKPITRIGKTSYPATVEFGFYGNAELEPLLVDLYQFLTSYEFGPRDLSMERLMANLSSDVFMAESLQEIVNALLADELGLTNAVKPIDAKVLEIAKQNNFLGKLTMFYKLLGHHNAVLNALTLNIAQELASRGYDMQGSMEQVQQFMEEITSLEDLKNNKKLEKIMNQTLGRHQEVLANKIYETINALHTAEIEMLTKYPELRNAYNQLRAIDKIEGQFMPELPQDIDPDILQGAIMDRSGVDPRFQNKKPTDNMNLFNAMMESFDGITGADAVELLEFYEGLQESFEQWSEEVVKYGRNREKYKWIKDFATAVNQIEGTFTEAESQGRNSAQLLAQEESFILKKIDDIQKLLDSPDAKVFKKSLLPIILDSLKEVDSKKYAKADLTTAETFYNNILSQVLEQKNLHKGLGEFPANAVDGFAALQRFIYDWSSFYLGENYLRIDNLFGAEDKFNLIGNEIENFDDELYKSRMITEEFASSLLPHIFKDGLENFFAASPTALQALMMNDTNINPAVQDKFIKSFVDEYGAIVFNNEAMIQSMQTMLPLLAQASFIDNGSLQLLIDEVYKLTDKGKPPKVDFNNTKLLKEYIMEVSDQLLSGSQLEGVEPIDMINTLEKVFPPNEFPELYRFISQDPGVLDYTMFVLETNLKRLAVRPENIEKIFNAEFSKLGIGEEFNWQEFKNKIAKGNVFKLLTGTGETFDIQPQRVNEIKNISKKRLSDMVFEYNKIMSGTGVQFKLVSNIPDKWDIKAQQGKNFNPFVVAPSKGADAFYHIQLVLQDPTKSFADVMSKEVAMAITHLLQVEQPTNFVNNTGLAGNYGNSLLRNGFLNSYLYADTLGEEIGMEALLKELELEIESTKVLFEKIKKDTLKNAAPEDVKKLEITFDYLESGLDEAYKLANARALTYGRQFVAEKGTKTFYGLDDAGAFPLAKLKIPKEYILGGATNVTNSTLFTNYIAPILLRNKTLDIEDMKQVQDVLNKKGVNFEIAQFVDVLLDLTEPKLGRKTLDNGLQLADELYNTIFFDKEDGFMNPAEVTSKEFKILQNIDKEYFLYLKHKFDQGIELKNIPTKQGVPADYHQRVQELLSGTYNIYKGTFDEFRSNIFTTDKKTIGEWWDETLEKYKIMQDRFVTPELGPADPTNFKDLGAMFLMQFSKDLSDGLIQDLYNQTNIDRTFALEMEEITSHLRKGNGLADIAQMFNIPLTPQLGSGIGKDLTIRGPVGWQIVQPRGEPIRLGPPKGPSDLVLRGKFSLLYDDSKPALVKGPNFGEGDPFRNAFRGPPFKRVKQPRDFTVLKTIVNAAKNIRYSKAKYQYNFGRGKELTFYTGGGPQSSVVPYEKVSPFKRYFRNLRTLTELPYFYNVHAGKGGPRVYVGYYLSQPVYASDTDPRVIKQPKMKAVFLPTKAGYTLNAAEFEDWYRTTKSAYLKQNLVYKPVRAYGKLNAAAFGADMLYAVNAYNKDTAGMTYDEFIEHAYTQPGQEMIHKIFYPIQKIMEAPFKAKENLMSKHLKLKQDLDNGVINQGYYLSEMDRLNQLYTVADLGTFAVTQVGRVFEGFMEGVPRNIGRQGEEARQTAELVAENFSADSEEEWLANIQNRYTDLAKTKHLTYNYGDDYYSRGRRFINKQMRKMKMFNRGKNEMIDDPEYTLEKPQDIYKIPGGLK